MPQKRRISVFLIILSCILTGCSLSLPPPSPTALMTVFTEPFLCSFTAHEGTEEVCRAHLARDLASDTLTVRGDYTETVLSCDGTAWTLITDGSADYPQKKIPLPDGFNGGAASFLPLFSVLPDDTFTSVRDGDTIVVSREDGSFSAVFSEDGVPCRITLYDRTVVIDSFSAASASIP